MRNRKGAANDSIWGFCSRTLAAILCIQIALGSLPGHLSSSALADRETPDALSPAFETPVIRVVDYVRKNRQILEKDPLFAAREKRADVIGADVERTIVDPYYIIGQRVKVVDDKKGTDLTYSFTDGNHKYGGPGGVYRLRYDVDVSFTSKEVHFTLQKGTKTFTHIFEIPGVVDFVKDQQTIYFLQRNGDIKTVLMAHSWLFQANEFAGGTPLITPLVGVIPPEYVHEDGSVHEDIRLVYYDSRQRDQYEFLDAFPEKAIDLLRTGDVLVVKERSQGEGKDQVVYVQTLLETTAALKIHLKGIFYREKALADELEPTADRFKAIMEGAAVGLAGRMEADAPLFAQLENRIAQEQTNIHSQEGLGRAFPRTQQSWKDIHKNEPFASPRLGETLGFLQSLDALARSLERRSTYPHDYNQDQAPENQTNSDQPKKKKQSPKKLGDAFSRMMPHYAEPGTPERQTEEQFAEMIAPAIEKADARKRNRLSRFFKGTVAGFKKLGVAALVASSPIISTAALFTLSRKGTSENLGQLLDERTGFFAEDMVTAAHLYWNQFLSILPSALTDPEHMRPLFNLLGYQGPTVHYSVAVLLNIALLSTVIVMIPQILSRMKGLGKRVLGRMVPSTESAGWQIFFTWSTRQVAHLFRSLREIAATMTGTLDRLHSARYGVLTDEYRRGSNDGKNAHQIATQVQNHQLRIQDVSFRLMVESAINLRILRPDTPLTAEGFREAMGEEGFQQFIENHSELADYAAEIAHQEGLLCTDDERAERLRQRLIDDWLARGIMVSPTIEIPEKYRRSSFLRKRSAQRRLWARAAGQNYLFYRFRHGEISEHVTKTAIGENFSGDMHTVAPFNAFVYSNLNNPEMLAASHLGFMGLFGVKPMSDYAFNLGGWIAQAPSEQLTFEIEQAANVDPTYQNPMLLDLSSQLMRILEMNGTPTFGESAKEYRKGFQNEHFWHGVQKLGERISTATPKTIKVLLALGVTLRTIPFLMEGHELGQSIVWGFNHVIFSGIFYASLAYRILWAWHNLAMAISRQGPDGEKRYLAHLSVLANISIASCEADGDCSSLESIENRYHSLYNRFGKKIPREILKIKDPAERLQKIVEEATKNPPTPMSDNLVFRKIATQGVAWSTTIIGTFGFLLGWQYAKDMSPALMGILWGGTHLAGEFFRRWGFKNRTVAYKNALESLKEALEYTPLEPEWREAALLAAIHQTGETYEHFGDSLPTSIVNLKTVNLDSDLENIAQKLLQHTLENPPGAIAKVKKAQKVQVEYSELCEPLLATP